VPYIELLFTKKSGIGWFYEIAYPSGCAIFVLIFLISFFTIRPIRRGKFFEVKKKKNFIFFLNLNQYFFIKLFLYTHRLYIIVIILLILHCKNYWKWFIVPAVFIAIEMYQRIYLVHSDNFGSTFIKDVKLLPSGVINLVIMRPKKFIFKAGDYLRINIPVISQLEYHPFTISSAPENKGKKK
jgi:hypothetical protein